MTDFSTPLETFLAYLREAEQRYSMAAADEQEETDVTQDILHNLELLEHSEDEIRDLGHALVQSRRKRRAAKDTLSACLPVKLYVDAHRREIKDLEQLLGEIRRAERRAEGRIYTPRSRRTEP